VGEYFCISSEAKKAKQHLEKQITTNSGFWVTHKTFTDIPYLLLPGNTYTIRQDSLHKHLLRITTNNKITNNELNFFPWLYIMTNGPKTHGAYLAKMENLIKKYMPVPARWNRYIDSIYAQRLALLQQYQKTVEISDTFFTQATQFLFYEHFFNKLRILSNVKNAKKSRDDDFIRKLSEEVETYAARLNCDECLRIPFYSYSVSSYERMKAGGNENRFSLHTLVKSIYTGKTLYYALFGLGSTAISKNDTAYLAFLHKEIAQYPNFDTVYKRYLTENGNFKALKQSSTFGYVLNNRQEKIHLDSLLKQSGIVYIDFWASWCAPCTEEIPNTVALAKAFASNSNYKIITLSIDENIVSWKNASSELNLSAMDNNYLAISLSKNIMQKLKNGIPRYMILKNGQLVNDNAPAPGDPKTKKLLETLGRK
jgi:thiol-disulfide isomerase/thioredoxin